MAEFRGPLEELPSVVMGYVVDSDDEKLGLDHKHSGSGNSTTTFGNHGRGSAAGSGKTVPFDAWSICSAAPSAAEGKSAAGEVEDEKLSRAAAEYEARVLLAAADAIYVWRGAGCASDCGLCCLRLLWTGGHGGHLA